MIDQRAPEQPEHVAHGAEQDLPHPGTRQAGLQRGSEVLEHDDGAGARVVELMLELARRIERVDVDDHAAGAQDGRDRDRILRDIGQHDRDPLTAAQAQALEAGRQLARATVEFGIAEITSHEAAGLATGILAEAGLEQFDQ